MTAPGATTVVPHMRLSWGGSLGIPAVEIWSNGLAFRVGPEAPSAAELQAVADAAANPIQDFVTNVNAQIGSAVSLEWVKAVWLLNNGRQRDTNTAMHDYPTPFPRGAKSTNPIWEQSYCVTLRTALNRGRGHAGRIYLPLAGPNPEGTTPYAPASYADNLAALYATFDGQLHTAINGVLPGTGRVAHSAISSRGTVDNPVPLLTNITGCVVDRVPDVQRRRVNRVQRLEGTRVNWT